MTESCNVTRESLSAYVDGELPPPRAEAIAEHLTTCAHCSVEYNTMLETVGLLRSGLARFAAPDVLRARIRAAVATTPSEVVAGEPLASAARRPPSAWARRSVWAAAVILAAALGSGVTLLSVAREQPGAPIASEVLASHLRSLMPDHLTDVRSSDQHNVKPWFNGRLDYSPSVPRLDDQGFPLVGGRIDYVAGRAVAVIVYGRRQHMINVFSWPAASADVNAAMTSANGYTMLRWRSGGVERWVVSDLNASELKSFAALFQHADSAASAARS